jgi:hypothetical protein
LHSIFLPPTFASNNITLAASEYTNAASNNNTILTTLDSIEMKKVINKFKQKLLPKAGKTNEHQSNKLSPSVASSIAQENRMREQQLAQCKYTCEQIIQKLKNKEPLSTHDYVQTMSAISALSDVRMKVD